MQNPIPHLLPVPRPAEHAVSPNPRIPHSGHIITRSKSISYKRTPVCHLLLRREKGHTPCGHNPSQATKRRKPRRNFASSSPRWLSPFPPRPPPKPLPAQPHPRSPPPFAASSSASLTVNSPSSK